MHSYTLAVGKAPFHASSKEEIYKKLKAGDYSWPELSSITNEISADLRNFVSSLLVAEELRPCPDQLVSHPFFRIAFVPKQMSRSQVTKAPSWPNVPPPSPEVLQRGYSDTWFHVCRESGVGEYAAGKCFQLNSGKRLRSIVRDIEKEVAAGRQPVIPIPSDTVYTPFLCSGTWAPQAADGLADIAEENDVPIESRHLREIAHNEVQQPAVVAVKEIVEVESKKRKDAEMMPPPSRLRRQGTTRRTRPMTEEVVQNAGMNEAGPVRPYSGAQFLQSVSSSATKVGPSSSQSEGGETNPVAKRTVDASLARRPRTVRKAIPEHEAPPSIALLEVLENAPPTKTNLPVRAARSRAKQPTPEVIEIYDEEVMPDRVVLPPPPSMHAKLPVPKRQTMVSSAALPGTDPTAVLDRLSQFRDNLASTLEKRHVAPSRKAPQQPIRPLPFVSKWVDYSRKHGVGYVLDDGTVGVIVNANAAKGTPVTHVVVRNGERWLNRVGKKQTHETLEQVPFQIMEDCGKAGIQAVVMTGTDEKARDRIRMLRILWVKFGRYMSQSLNGSDEEVASDDVKDASDLFFVRFYQRMGNVGVWGFSDGCVQVSPVTAGSRCDGVLTTALASFSRSHKICVLGGWYAHIGNIGAGRRSYCNSPKQRAANQATERS